MKKWTQLGAIESTVEKHLYSKNYNSINFNVNANNNFKDNKFIETIENSYIEITKISKKNNWAKWKRDDELSKKLEAVIRKNILKDEFIYTTQIANNHYRLTLDTMSNLGLNVELVNQVQKNIPHVSGYLTSVNYNNTLVRLKSNKDLNYNDVSSAYALSCTSKPKFKIFINENNQEHFDNFIKPIIIGGSNFENNFFNKKNILYTQKFYEPLEKNVKLEINQDNELLNKNIKLRMNRNNGYIDQRCVPVLITPENLCHNLNNQIAKWGVDISARAWKNNVFMSGIKKCDFFQLNMFDDDYKLMMIDGNKTLFNNLINSEIYDLLKYNDIQTFSPTVQELMIITDDSLFLKNHDNYKMFMNICETFCTLSKDEFKQFYYEYLSDNFFSSSQQYSGIKEKYINNLKKEAHSIILDYDRANEDYRNYSQFLNNF